jgi:LCP family protein required for cell wall assembly
MKRGKVTLIVFSALFLIVGTLLIGANYYLSKFDFRSQDDFQLLSSAPEDQKDASLDPNAPVNNNPGAMQYGTGNILSSSNIQNILLIGVDTRDGQTYGGSDSMIILSINKSTKQVKMTSIMRDTFLRISGVRDNRINYAYSYGGPKLLINTIQNNFRVKIDNYVDVDFDSFRKVIDLLGGVQIDLTAEEVNEINFHSGSSQTVHSGTNKLDGLCALAYARIRHIGDDQGRTQRQRNVIASIATSMKHSNLATVLHIADEVFPLITTDLPKTQIVGLAMDYSALTSKTMEQCRLPAEGTYENQTIREMSVLKPDVEANKKILWKFIYNYEG